MSPSRDQSGGWTRTAGLTALLAIAGAAAAIGLSHRHHGGTPSTLVTTTTPTTTATTTATTPTTTPATTAAAPANGSLTWPSGRTGWTTVLGSYPVSGGESAARNAARTAVRAGLPQVGVLDSGSFGSLRAGYFVVFSGMYASEADAQAAATAASHRGFASSYPRRVAP